MTWPQTTPDPGSAPQAVPDPAAPNEAGADTGSAASADTGTVAVRRLGFGVDIGGTGIKGASVDLETGQLASERLRLKTPKKSTPENVAKVVAEVVAHFGWTEPIGATFPAPILGGVAMTAANVDKSWIGTDVSAVLTSATGRPCTALNDADAAGLAEVRFGAGRDVAGVVIMVTLGTGIGSAMFLDGKLVPNTELGHLEVNGKEAEKRASELVREREGLSWTKWAHRLTRYFETLERLFSPDLFIVGGGVSKEANKFLPLIAVRTRVVPATLLNEAGIVGAALAADTAKSTSS